jgi:hypothetical protein
MAPKQNEQMAACNAAVANYQAQQQAEQAALQQQQAAEQAAQQQRAQELASYKHHVAAQIKARQDAVQRIQAAAMQQLQTRANQQQQISAALQNSGVDATASGQGTAATDVPNPVPGPTPNADGSTSSAQDGAAAAVPAPAPTPTPSPNPSTDPAAASTAAASGESPSAAADGTNPSAALTINPQAPTFADPSAATGAPGTGSGTSWDDPANPPGLSADALNSTNPDIQNLVAKYQSLQNIAVNNQSTQADLTKWAAEGKSDSYWAGALGSFVALAKLPADATAAVLGTNPETEWFSVAYGAATNMAQQISKGLIFGGEQGGESTGVSPEALESTADFLSLSGKTMQNGSPFLGSYTSSIGTGVSVGGGVLGLAVNASEGDEAAAQGNTYKATTSYASAIANGAQVVGTLTQNSELGERAGALGAAATIANSVQASYNAALDAGQAFSYGATTIPQNYANAYARTQALNAQLAAQEQAIYQQIQQLTQAQNATQPVILNVPLQ